MHAHPAAADQTTGFLYQTVVNLLRQHIEEGTLQPGERLPSLRGLGQKLGVSIATVMKAYQELERMGYLEVRPQSGHYVTAQNRDLAPKPRRSSPPGEPRTVDKFRFIYSILEAQRDPAIVPLGSAVPAAGLLPGGELARLGRSALSESEGSGLGYGAVEGEPRLRQQIAYRLLDAGARVHADELIITDGATEGLSLALRALTRPGDVVAVESPCYFLYLQLLETLGLRGLEIATDPELGMEPSALAQALRSHPVNLCLLQPNFGNPLGGLVPAERRQELLALLTGAGVTVVEDDVYGDLPFDGHRPPSLLTLGDGHDVVQVSSFSKTLAPGYRIGWIRPGRHYDAVLRLKVSSTLASPRPTQLVVAAYLASGRYGRHLRRLRSAFRDQVATFRAHATRCFPAGTRLSRPAGGFVLWLELPPGHDAVALYRAALAHGIGISPGPIFSATDRFRTCLRLNCGYPWSDKLAQAVETLGWLASDGTAAPVNRPA